MKTKMKKILSIVLALCLLTVTQAVIATAADSNYTVTVGGVVLTADNTTIAYAINDSEGTVITDGADANNHTIRFELVDGVPTLTLIDATIKNTAGDAIKSTEGDLTINGIDTAADGSNAISGSINSISAEGNIVISGTLGNIIGGSNSAVYSDGGNITIALGAVVGDLQSDWYTLQTESGNIVINGKVGNISGEIGITSEYNHDVIINGEVGNISGTNYGVFAYKNFIVAKDAKVGNVSGVGGGIMAISDVIIEGTVGDISGTHGIYAANGVNISGTINRVSGQCAIRAISADIDISGTIGAVAANGGTNNLNSSYGIRADGGKIIIKNAIGPVSAGSDGENVTVIALVAKNGIETAGNVAIKLPKNSKIDLYGTSYYTVYNTENSENPTIAEKVEFTYVYTVTFVAGGKTVTTVKVNHGEDVTLPTIPVKSGYTAAWSSDGKMITADTQITAVYTKIPASNIPNDPNLTPTGDNSNLTLWVVLMIASGACFICSVIYNKKRAKNK